MEKEKLNSILCLRVWPIYFFLFFAPTSQGQGQELGEKERVSVINVTDTYHPYQDVGDNFDLIMAYALPEIDLKAIVFDVTGAFLKPIADHPFLYKDPHGPRESGIIPILQLNRIFNKGIPFAPGPYTVMKSSEDKKLDAPAFQQRGVELLLKTLRETKGSVEIVSFGSARPVAVAYNRSPELFHSKVRKIHLSAGTASKNFELGNSKSHNVIPGGEWNVALDPVAFVHLLESDLPIAIYPCATKDGAYELGKHNTYWQLPNLQFIQKMDPQLQNYLNFAFDRSLEFAFLEAMDQNPKGRTAPEAYKEPHHVWEKPVWIQVSGRKLVQRNGGNYRIVPQNDVLDSDRIIKSELKQCLVKFRDDGRFDFELTDHPSNFEIFIREDPVENQQALQQALPALYRSFKIDQMTNSTAGENN